MGARRIEKELERQSGELKRRSDELKRRSAELGRKTEEVRQDWERKRADPAVPGALPPDEQGDSDSTESPDPSTPPS